MGCAQSRIENEEAVARCKERRQFMKDAVAARNAFAAAHSAYVVALKNTGAALSDFGQGEAPDDATEAASVARVGPSSVSGAPSASSASGIAPPMENLPPPPPPLPDFSPSPLQRSISMPDLPKKYSSKSPIDVAIREEEGDEMDESVNDNHAGARGAAPSGAAPVGPSPSPSPQPPLLSRQKPSPSPPPPPMPESGGLGTWDYFFPMDENMSMPGPSLSQADEIHAVTEEPVLPPPLDQSSTGGDLEEEPPATPEKVVVEPPVTLKGAKKKQGGMVHHQHAVSTSVLETKKGKLAASTSNVSLLQVLIDLDEHFLRASMSAHDVSKMLEATRMHYHSNFADNRGHIDHSARVMRVITWNRSFKGVPYANDGKDDFDNDEWETHATVLDKMLAWEKKLYDEVKAGEIMKFEYQRKVALLNRQKKRGANPESIEKTKAAVSHLHTRYIVDMQSMDSTVSEIQHLRDDQLYPRLVDLVDGMEKMWETMFFHHDSQLKVVIDLRVLDILNTPKETSENHYSRTVQLYEFAKAWQSQFQKLIGHQKEYIQALNSWLKLNLKPIESSLKEKVSSPPRAHHPPIQTLLYAWNDQLEKLPDDLAKSAISSFSAVINTIILLQQEELKLKDKCEETRREYTRKSRAFEDWLHRYSQRRAGSGASGDAENAEAGNVKDPVIERKFLVDTLKTKLDDDIEAYQKICKQVREKTLGSLKTHLPELFRAMSDFAMSSSDMYKKLKAISSAQDRETAG